MYSTHLHIKRLLLILLFLSTCIYSVGQSTSDLNGRFGLREKIPASEYEALVDLYNSTTGNEAWTGWLDPEAPYWEGVDVEGVVVTIVVLRSDQVLVE